MSAFYIMIGVSLAIAIGFLGAFVWSVRRGHYDDDYTPSVRILLDDTDIPASADSNDLNTLHQQLSGK